MFNAFVAAIDVTAYLTALDELTDALATAIPTVAVAALGVAAGLIVLRIGVRIIKRFASG
jgi:predicted lysophospholipase L1 biosynthesis ABC-type transport system permease subunit